MIATETARRIVELLAVVDTREYEEIADGVFKPIPGSGSESICARCGRSHEVHATVRVDDGSTIIVGTGCAARESTDLAAKFKAGASAAKTLARLRAERAVLASRAASYVKACDVVDALPVPAAVVVQKSYGAALEIADDVASGHAGLRYADATDPERVRCARDGWRRGRIAHALAVDGFRVFSFEQVGSAIETLDGQLGKVERRLTALAGK